MIATWAFFFATGRSVVGSIVLALSALYVLIDTVPRIWRRWKKCR